MVYSLNFPAVPRQELNVSGKFEKTEIYLCIYFDDLLERPACISAINVFFSKAENFSFDVYPDFFGYVRFLKSFFFLILCFFLGFFSS